MTKYDLYLEAKRQYDLGNSFLRLLDKRDSQSGSHFMYSPRHSKIMLMICGQFYAGGKNYHESEDKLNTAILEAIKPRELISAGVENLRLKMVEALKNSEAEVAAVQSMIAAAKEEGAK